MKPALRNLPLRVKLVLAALAVEAVMLMLLVANGARLGDATLAAQGSERTDALGATLAQALVAPLVQEDRAAVRELLNALHQQQALSYAEVRDTSGQLVHQVGEPDADTLIRGQPVVFSGQQYGQLALGISGEFMRSARAEYLRQSVAIALATLVITGFLLVAVVRWLTRRLEALSRASRALADGKLDTPLPAADTADEVGQLVASFGYMVSTVRTNIESARYNQALTVRYLQETELERARLAALLSAMNLGVLFVAPDGKVVYCNPAFLRIWGYAADADLIGRPVRQVLAEAQSAVAEPGDFSRHLNEALAASGASVQLEIRLADGRILTEFDYPVRGRDARLSGHLWVYEDITVERQTAEQLIYLAERDPLTGLANRYRFQRELDQALATTDRQQRQSAVMFFDLDEFKAINDTHGHRAGDALLIRIANEISTLVRRNEIFARLGGDEFAVLLPHARPGEAETLAARIVGAVAQMPFVYEGRSLRASASLGIASYPAQAATAEELIAHADIAMYQAKSAGKNTWRVFQPDSATEGDMRKRLSDNEAITSALDNQHFVLFFQGVYRCDTGALSHLEALVRMHDVRHAGQIALPADFIPAAEKSGRIAQIDRWVITEALRVLNAHPQLTALAVKLSGRTVSEPGLPQFIADALQQSGVDPARVYFEITETAVVADLIDAQRLIDALHQLGCRVCLDDFGVGFASFAYLKHIAVDTIKIDGLFVRTLADDHDDQIFVRAMVDVARGLGKTVVAECVEDARTLNLLQALGVDYVQGWHLDRPTATHPALTGKDGI